MTGDKKKLLFDEMLKKACAWMRIFGIDSAYAGGRDDDALLKAALDGGLVLATRDVELAKQCAAHGARCVLVRSDKAEAQIAQIAEELGLEFGFPEESRCPACNGELRAAGKKEAEGKVPDNVFAQNEEYWVCVGCGKIYWRGGHWANITRIFENVKAALKQTNKKQ